MRKGEKKKRKEEWFLSVSERLKAASKMSWWRQGSCLLGGIQAQPRAPWLSTELRERYAPPSRWLLVHPLSLRSLQGVESGPSPPLGQQGCTCNANGRKRWENTTWWTNICAQNQGDSSEAVAVIITSPFPSTIRSSVKDYSYGKRITLSQEGWHGSTQNSATWCRTLMEATILVS